MQTDPRVYPSFYFEVGSVVQQEGFAAGGDHAYIDTGRCQAICQRKRAVRASPWERWKAPANDGDVRRGC